MHTPFSPSLPPSPLGGIPSLSNPLAHQHPLRGVRRRGKGGGGRGFAVIYGCLHPPLPTSSSHTHFIQPLLISIHFPFDLSVCLFFLLESGCVLLHEEGNCKLHFTHARSLQSCKKRVDITLLTPIFCVFVRGEKKVCAPCAVSAVVTRHLRIHGVCY